MRKNKKFVAVLTTAAMMTMTMASMAMGATTQRGWVQDDNGDWYWYKNADEYVENTWKQSGDFWFYLGDDGVMMKDAFIEDDGNYYYVNGDGVMSTNQWRFIETDDTDGENHWFYFGANGRAYVDKTDEGAKLREINGKNYVFDEHGIMQYGWLDADGRMVDEDNEDAWKEAVYYAGEESDGAIAEGWRDIDVVDEDNDDYPGYYWFYFKSNGKKTVNIDDKEIDGYKYGFDEYGVMLSDFSQIGEIASGSNAVTAYKYYQDFDNGINKRTGWFKAVPSEEINPDGFDEGEEKWFYANSNGSLKASTLSSINGKKYAFNEYGEMLHGLIGLEMDGNTILSYTDIIETEDDLAAVEASDYVVYYFGDEEDGSMKKDSVSIEIDGEDYSYMFNTKGEAREGIYKDKLYVKGRRIEADSEQGYVMVELDGTETETVGTAYLINTSGKVQKNKTNVKDKDDMYYCTNSDGVVTYVGAEKYVAE